MGNHRVTPYYADANIAPLQGFAITTLPQGFSLSLGNMVRGYGFDLQGIRFHDCENSLILYVGCRCMC